MSLIKDIINILLPRECPVCERTLEPSETFLCTSCLVQLPFYDVRKIEDNELLRKLWAYVPVQYGATLLYYRKDSPFHKILMRMKYEGAPGLAIEMGKIAGQKLLDMDFMSKVDVIVPVPLTKNKRRKRGYNQSERLAEGISRITGCPVDEMLYRTKDREAQIHLNASQRRINAEGIYQARITDRWKGKRILLVDDVFTSGATLLNCAKAILKEDNTAQISIFTLAYDG